MPSKERKHLTNLEVLPISRIHGLAVDSKSLRATHNSKPLYSLSKEAKVLHRESAKEAVLTNPRAHSHRQSQEAQTFVT